jgi:hypothetical protein
VTGTLSAAGEELRLPRANHRPEPCPANPAAPTAALTPLKTNPSLAIADAHIPLWDRESRSRLKPGFRLVHTDTSCPTVIVLHHRPFLAACTTNIGWRRRPHDAGLSFCGPQAENLIAIAEPVSRDLIKRKCLAQLLCCPFRRGMLGTGNS